MTKEEIAGLTDQELLDKILQIPALEWEDTYVSNEYEETGGGDGDWGFYDVLRGTHKGVKNVRVPQYVTDLNAVHALEVEILHPRPTRWLEYLELLRNRRDYAFGGACAEVSASARQRAEAFLLVMQE